jgi:hypothetical protein
LIAPFGLLLVNTAASFGILCLGIVDRSGSVEFSAQESVGEDDAGLGGKLLPRGGPGGAGLSRDDRESMAVSSCGVACVSRKLVTLLQQVQVQVAYGITKVRERRLRNEETDNSRQRLHRQIREERWMLVFLNLANRISEVRSSQNGEPMLAQAGRDCFFS